MSDFHKCFLLLQNIFFVLFIINIFGSEQLSAPYSLLANYILQEKKNANFLVELEIVSSMQMLTLRQRSCYIRAAPAQVKSEHWTGEAPKSIILDKFYSSAHFCQNCKFFVGVLLRPELNIDIQGA